jgi:hypothetical protein
MPRFINPEDWFLVLTVLSGLASLPLVLLAVAAIFHIPVKKVFDLDVWKVVGQMVGIVAFTLLLVQVGVDSDGLGAKLIYGRF